MSRSVRTVSLSERRPRLASPSSARSARRYAPVTSLSWRSTTWSTVSAWASWRKQTSAAYRRAALSSRSRYAEEARTRWASDFRRLGLSHERSTPSAPVAWITRSFSTSATSARGDAVPGGSLSLWSTERPSTRSTTRSPSSDVRVGSDTTAPTRSSTSAATSDRTSPREPPERGGRREQDAAFPEVGLGARDQPRRAFEVGRFLPEVVAEPLVLGTLEGPDPEVIPDGVGVEPERPRVRGVARDEALGLADADLGGDETEELAVDLEGLQDGRPPGEPDEGELVGEPEPGVVVPQPCHARSVLVREPGSADGRSTEGGRVGHGGYRPPPALSGGAIASRAIASRKARSTLARDGS